MKPRWQRNQQRIMLLALAIGIVIGLSACGESFTRVDANHVLITENGGLDSHNYRIACGEAGFKETVRTVWSVNPHGRSYALIECR
jgi:hypothetical protein